MRSHRLVSAGLVVAAAAISAAPVSAQGYPTKPIELVVPFVAGGTTDKIARLMAQRFTESWSQTVIVNNRPGAGSAIGTSAVAKSAPDGHTLLVTTFAFAANPALAKVPFDPIRDFAPITELASLPMMLLVHPSVPAKDLAEFIALAKSSPAGLDYASSGPGTSTHLAAEMFNTMAGVRLVHVPYKGNAEVFNALLGGHIKVHFSLVPSGIAHVRAGTLRALAVTTEQRLPYLPDVPTVAESGFPAYEISSWQGVFARAATRPDVVAKINSELLALLKTPAMRERMAREGADPVGSTPQQFSQRVASEVEKWSKVAKAAGLATN
jgi:tripartite-type tricarboxylate transporter receptor subunit TctC